MLCIHVNDINVNVTKLDSKWNIMIIFFRDYIISYHFDTYSLQQNTPTQFMVNRRNAPEHATTSKHTVIRLIKTILI